MKAPRPSSLLMSVVLFSSAFALFGQTNEPPNTGDLPPQSPAAWMHLLISALTTVVIAGIKWLAPRIPKVVLPFIAPFVGLALDQLAAFLTAHEGNLVIGAIAGGLGVWLRELYDQSKKYIASKNTANPGYTSMILIGFIVLGTGCSSVKISPALVRQGVATGVAYSVAKYPTSVPYLRAADGVICYSANVSTNLDPVAIIAAIEASGATAFKTPEGVLILNTALSVYIYLWESYGEEAVNKSPMFREYLQATCFGINDSLPPATAVMAAPKAEPYKYDWPLIRF